MISILETKRAIQHKQVDSIETESAIVHGNRKLIRFAAREEKVKKVIESLVYPSYGLTEEEIKIVTS